MHLKPNGDFDGEHIGVRRDPTFWRGDVSYTFDRTNKNALDRPTVTIAIPVELLGIEDFTPAAADFCLREIRPYFDEENASYYNRSRLDSDNGRYLVHNPSSKVLPRNTAYFAMRPAKDYENGSGARIYVCEYNAPPPDNMCVCIRFEIQLSNGNLKRAKHMLTKVLCECVNQFVGEFDRRKLAQALELERKQNAIREWLRTSEYCAFIANGSVLAREKGGDLPMQGALPFHSVPEDEIEVVGVRGQGIRRGVTVITGGGYSGKSTIINAISAGIYNHIAGDGRELCITDESAVTITAEDGRCVSSLNISPFIKWIPSADTKDFSTHHASGSTSQAANIMEAISCGSKLLLIDEDRSATNFMIRDALMKELIEKEPITPFTDRVRELAANGVSTILVIGGSGEYLSVADKIYMMDDFVIHDVTSRARELARAADVYPSSADWTNERGFTSDNFTSYPAGSGTERLEVSDTGFIIIGDARIDLRTLHDMATPEQVNALAFMLLTLEREADNGDEFERVALAMRGLAPRTKAARDIDIKARVRELYERISREGLDVVDTGFFVGMGRYLDLPREIEVYAAVNRMRGLRWRRECREPRGTKR